MSWRGSSATTSRYHTVSPSSLTSVRAPPLSTTDIGIWAWATSLHFLSYTGIDPSLVLHPWTPSDDHPLTSHPHRPLNRRDIYKPPYALAIILTTVTCISLTLFWGFTSGDASAVVSYEFLPLSCFASILLLTFCPFNILYRDERLRFLRMLRRILVGGLNQEAKFGDVMLADILTSYAKVLGDLWVTGCMLLGAVSATGKPDRACGGKLAVPLVISLPYLIRLRQCFIEFSRSKGEGTMHLLNALKYASAFPVILLSAMQRTYISPVEDMYPDKVWFGESMLFRLWYPPRSLLTQDSVRGD
jgi:EXS family